MPRKSTAGTRRPRRRTAEENTLPQATAQEAATYDQFFFCATCGERWPRDPKYVFDYGRHCKQQGHQPGGVCDADGNVIIPYEKKYYPPKNKQPKLAAGVVSARTGELDTAQFIEFYSVTSRVPYTPIMRQARRAAVEQWDWPVNTPFDAFIDKVLEVFFADRGIVLGAYAIEKEE